MRVMSRHGDRQLLCFLLCPALWQCCPERELLARARVIVDQQWHPQRIANTDTAFRRKCRRELLEIVRLPEAPIECPRSAQLQRRPAARVRDVPCRLAVDDCASGLYAL